MEKWILLSLLQVVVHYTHIYRYIPEKNNDNQFYNFFFSMWNLYITEIHYMCDEKKYFKSLLDVFLMIMAYRQ